MPSEEAKARLSGNETVRISGFAIAYNAVIESPSGHNCATFPGPILIQEDGIPGELHEPILSIIDAFERRRWGLPPKEEGG